MDSGNCCDEKTNRVREGKQLISFRTCAPDETPMPTAVPTPTPTRSPTQGAAVGDVCSKTRPKILISNNKLCCDENTKTIQVGKQRDLNVYCVKVKAQPTPQPTPDQALGAGCTFIHVKSKCNSATGRDLLDNGYNVNGMKVALSQVACVWKSEQCQPKRSAWSSKDGRRPLAAELTLTLPCTQTLISILILNGGRRLLGADDQADDFGEAIEFAQTLDESGEASLRATPAMYQPARKLMDLIGSPCSRTEQLPRAHCCSTHTAVAKVMYGLQRVSDSSCASQRYVIICSSSLILALTLIHLKVDSSGPSISTKSRCGGGIRQP